MCVKNFCCEHNTQGCNYGVGHFYLNSSEPIRGDVQHYETLEDAQAALVKLVTVTYSVVLLCPPIYTPQKKACNSFYYKNHIWLKNGKHRSNQKLTLTPLNSPQKNVNLNSSFWQAKINVNFF